MTNVTEKYCTRCKTLKPTTLFHIDKSKLDGLSSHCGKCRVFMSGQWAKRKRAALAQFKKPRPKKVKILKGLPRKDITLHQRFERTVYHSIDGCHYWVGHTTESGYGHIKVNYKSIRAHRLAYILYKNIDPANLLVCHSCDNRLCVNPDHLFLGTHQDNMDDLVKKRQIKKIMSYGKEKA